MADRENSRVQIFSPEGDFLSQWAHLARPTDIYIDTDNTVYVTEFDALICIMTLGGEVLARWTVPTVIPGEGNQFAIRCEPVYPRIAIAI